MGDLAEDVEVGNIESRVTQHDAARYHKMWRKLLAAYKAEGGDIDALWQRDEGTNNDSELLGEGGESVALTKLKDQLFIDSGEDPLDIFAAF